MSMDDEFRDPEVIQQVEILAMEFEEAFDFIRGHTKSDACAWFVVDAFLDWKRVQRLQVERKRKGDRPVSDAQLKELGTHGVESLADLSRNEAQALLDRFGKNGSEDKDDEEDGWY